MLSRYLLTQYRGDLKSIWRIRHNNYGSIVFDLIGDRMLDGIVNISGRSGARALTSQEDILLI